MIANRLILFLLLFGQLFLVKGQAPNRPGGLDQDQSNNNAGQEVAKDTIPAIYFYKNNPSVEFNYQDTSLGYNFMQHDPARQSGHEWVHLGNMGSAARPILFTPIRNTGLDVGLHSYDLYKKSFSEIRLFKLNSPMTTLFFTQGQGQENSMMKGLFSRNFSKGIHVNLDYRRINQTGIYIHQKNRNTAFTSTLWYQHPRHKWDLHLSYLYNKIEAEDNGGVFNLSSLEATENNPATQNNRGVVDVFLRQAMTRHRENGIELNLDYYLDKIPTDSITPIEKTQLIQGSISFTEKDYLSYNNSLDSAYYGHFQVDDRGLRSFINHTQFSTALHYGWRLNDTTYFKPFIKVGLKYDHNIVRRDLDQSTITNLSIQGEFNKKLWPGAEINAVINAYFADHVGDLKLTGQFSQQIRSNILIGDLEIQRFQPSLTEKSWRINNDEFWVNNFKDPSLFKWGGHWVNENYGWKIGLNNYVLNNWIYYNDSAVPAQLNNVEIVLSIYAEKYFKFGKWRTFHYLLYQESSNSAIPLPQLYAKTGIYLSSYIFKKALLFQPGLDLRWNSKYKVPGYFPLSNQFYVQDEFDLGSVPLVDLFINFKVSSFRAFVKMENIVSFFSDKVYFQTALYPYFDAEFRLGISWELRN